MPLFRLMLTQPQSKSAKTIQGMKAQTIVHSIGTKKIITLLKMRTQM